jgi:hypothetical protein
MATQAKPIWIAEMNWNAAPEDVEPRYGRVTLEQQARYLPLAYQRIIEDWPWIGVAEHVVPQARHRPVGAEPPARSLFPPAGARLHPAAGL